VINRLNFFKSVPALKITLPDSPHPIISKKNYFGHFISLDKMFYVLILKIGKNNCYFFHFACPKNLATACKKITSTVSGKLLPPQPLPLLDSYAYGNGNNQ